METQIIRIPRIVLEWSEWTAWHMLHADARNGAEGATPPKAPGVYEVRQRRCKKRLTIGETSNLRHRIKQGVVRGSSSHSAGKRIREHERAESIVIRWAETNRPCAVQEHLHRAYRERFGTLPKYTKCT